AMEPKKGSTLENSKDRLLHQLDAIKNARASLREEIASLNTAETQLDINLTNRNFKEIESNREKILQINYRDLGENAIKNKLNNEMDKFKTEYNELFNDLNNSYNKSMENINRIISIYNETESIYDETAKAYNRIIPYYKDK